MSISDDAWSLGDGFINFRQQIWGEQIFRIFNMASIKEQKAFETRERGNPEWASEAKTAIKAYSCVIEIFEASKNWSSYSLSLGHHLTDPTDKELKKIKLFQIIPASQEKVIKLNRSLINYYKSLDQAKTQTLLTINQLASKIRRIAQKKSGVLGAFLQRSSKFREELNELAGEAENTKNSIIGDLAGSLGVKISQIAIRTILPGAGDLLVALATLPEKIRNVRARRQIDNLAREIEELAQKSTENRKIEHQSPRKGDFEHYIEFLLRDCPIESRIRDTKRLEKIHSEWKAEHAEEAKNNEISLTPNKPRVNTSFSARFQATRLPRIAFGKADWEKYFGRVGVEPPLPPTIEEILQSPCPFSKKSCFKRIKVEDSHILVLIPKTVDEIFVQDKKFL